MLENWKHIQLEVGERDENGPESAAEAILRAPRGGVGRPMTWMIFDPKEGMKVHRPQNQVAGEAEQVGENVTAADASGEDATVEPRDVVLDHTDAVSLVFNEDDSEILFSTDEHDMPPDEHLDASLPSLDSAGSDWSISECTLLHPVNPYSSASLRSRALCLAEILELPAAPVIAVEPAREVGNDTSFIIDEEVDTPVLVPFCIGDDDDEEEEEELHTPPLDDAPLPSTIAECCPASGAKDPLAGRFSLSASPAFHESLADITDPDVPTISIHEDDSMGSEYQAKSLFDFDSDSGESQSSPYMSAISDFYHI